MELEIRDLVSDELRAEDADGGSVIRASIKFNTLSVPIGMFTRFREKIEPQAFDSILNDETREVLAFWNHNHDMPLGRRSKGTLSLSRTDTLFKAEIHPPDTSWGEDAVKSIRRGDVSGLSFGFRVFPQGERWEEDKDKSLVRVLTNLDLLEVSPTPLPAYPKSSASVRSLEQVYERHQQEIAAKEQLAAEQFAERQRRGRLLRSISAKFNGR